MSRKSKRPRGGKSTATKADIRVAVSQDIPGGKAAQHAWEVSGVCAILVFLVFAVFGQTIGYGFVNFDDHSYIYQNPVISKGLSLAGIRWAFTHIVVGNWHPLTTIVHMLDCQLYGLWAGGHHLTNVLLHAGCAVLLFLVLREMTGALLRSAFVAALFAIHPLRVESVAWVSELKDVLSGLFFMLTLWAYVRYARGPRSRGRIMMVMVWFALGLMSKPMLVTVPFVLLLLDFWPLDRLQRWSQLPALLKEKAALFALTALSCVATVMAQQRAIQQVKDSSLPVRLDNALVAYVVYLGKLIWPSHLVVLYPLIKGGPPVWQAIGGFVLLAGLTAATFLLRRRHPYFLVGWLWYLGMLVPVIGILQVGRQAYADRYTYLPEIGLCIAGVWAAADWAGRNWNRRMLLGAAGTVILAALAIAACVQTTMWRDSETLWTHALESNPENVVARITLGFYYYEAGRPDMAIAEYGAALRIDPTLVEGHTDLGNALLKEGRTDKAVSQYREAMRIDPGYADAHYNLANVLLKTGSTGEAIAEYLETVRLEPSNADAHGGLGNALFQAGRTQEAIAQYGEACKINPEDAIAHVDLGVALCQQGRVSDGIAEYREALRINPAIEEAHANLGVALFEQGHADEAMAEYRLALQIGPNDMKTHGLLATALLRQGNIAGAIAQLEKALELQPADIGTENSLAWLLATAPQSSLRNGSAAVELATRASESTGGNDPRILRTLAAAYAQAGLYSNAAQTGRKALQLARAQGQSNLVNTLQQEINLYEAGHPFGESR